MHHEFRTTAAHHIRGNKHYLFYKEYQENGESMDCRLMIAPEEIIVKKGQKEKTILRFREKSKQQCHCFTPMGALSLISDTRKIRIREEADGLYVEIDYDLYTGNSLLSEYALQIQVSP